MAHHQRHRTREVIKFQRLGYLLRFGRHELAAEEIRPARARCHEAKTDLLGQVRRRCILRHDVVEQLHAKSLSRHLHAAGTMQSLAPHQSAFRRARWLRFQQLLATARPAVRKHTRCAALEHALVETHAFYLAHQPSRGQVVFEPFESINQHGPRRQASALRSRYCFTTRERGAAGASRTVHRGIAHGRFNHRGEPWLSNEATIGPRSS